ncbi:MAG: hypothetical protein ACPGVB_14680 [Chitinophagales bacterium]
MAELTLKLDNEVVTAYQSADEKTRNKIDFWVNKWLKDLLNPNPKERLLQTMHKASEEAQANDLTMEELNKILSDNG